MTKDSGQSRSDTVATSHKAENSMINVIERYRNILLFVTAVVARKLMPAIPKNRGHKCAMFFHEEKFRK